MPDRSEEQRGRILVVDDNPDLCFMLVERLTSVGFHADDALNGPEAIAKATKDKFDVLVLDIRMPGMDGFAVLNELQGIEDPPSVIFLSADENRKSRIRGLESGAVDFIAKPFDAEELIARITSALRQKKAIAKARDEALTDGLTGIGNRRYFDLFLKSEFELSERSGHKMGLVYIDINDFKFFNDTYGHFAGDACLKIVAQALKKTSRASDKPCRIGGDEFGVILPETGREQARHFVERLHENMARAAGFEAGGERPVKPSISVGVAVYPNDAGGTVELVKVADEALYNDKRRQKRENTSKGKSGAEMSETRTTQPPSTQTAKAKPTVGLIEDDPDIAEIVQVRLEGSGYAVHHVANLEEGRKMIEAVQLDLLILDIMLPDGSGMDLLGELRSAPTTRALPVVMLTGMGAPTNIETGFSVGANAYLTKPFDSNQLIEAIEVLLEE